MEILQYIIDNIGAIVAGATLVLGGLAVIAKLTSNPTDDKWIAKLLGILKLIPISKEKKEK